MAGNRDIPWDIYVDECKESPRCLGFLVVPNTASFAQKLYRCRQHPPTAEGKTMETREIHFSRLHRGLLPTALKWIDMTFQHKHAKFYLLDWPRTDTKEVVTLRMLRRFCRRRRLSPPYNVVTIFDYDSTHARATLQNTIRTAGQIARCYHLDSSKNDSLQCCDLLLGATRRSKLDAAVHQEFPGIREKRGSGQNLSNSEVKKFVAGYLAMKVAEQADTVYDFMKVEPVSGRSEIER